MSETLRLYLATLSADQREALCLDRYFQVEGIAERFGVEPHQVRSLALELNKPSPERFLWLSAVNRAAGQQIITQKALGVAVALFGSFNDRSPYAWPNQRTIAAACGWNQTRGVREGLAKLEEVGAVTRIPARNLPVEIAAQVFGAKGDGGSGRDIRAMAYRRNDPKVWQISDSGMDHSANKRNGSFRLNHKGKPQLASPEEVTHSSIGDPPFTSHQVETYQYGTDGTETPKKELSL